MDPLTDIRRRRRVLGLPLSTLARAVGRSDATLSRIERGQIRPSYELVQRIVSYLDEQEGALMPGRTARDVLTRSVHSVDGGTPLLQAARLMEQHGISQTPVVDAGKVTGSLSEAAVLRALAHQPPGRGSPTKVREVQESAYPQVDVDFPVELLATLLTHVPAVLISHRGIIQGIVTKTDLIRGLRGNATRRPGAE
ncbi:MAG: CBS domain-containing protein [Thermoplasmata archaeon]